MNAMEKIWEETEVHLCDHAVKQQFQKVQYHSWSYKEVFKSMASALTLHSTKQEKTIFFLTCIFPQYRNARCFGQFDLLFKAVGWWQQYMMLISFQWQYSTLIYYNCNIA